MLMPNLKENIELMFLNSNDNHKNWLFSLWETKFSYVSVEMLIISNDKSIILIRKNLVEPKNVLKRNIETQNNLYFRIGQKKGHVTIEWKMIRKIDNAMNKGIGKFLISITNKKNDKVVPARILTGSL